MSEPTFKGWHALDEKSIGNMVWKEFTPVSLLVHLRGEAAG